MLFFLLAFPLYVVKYVNMKVTLIPMHATLNLVSIYRGTTAIVALQCVEGTHSLNRQTAWTYCPKCDESVYVQTQISCWMLVLYPSQVRLTEHLNEESAANFQSFHVESLNRERAACSMCQILSNRFQTSE